MRAAEHGLTPDVTARLTVRELGTFILGRQRADRETLRNDVQMAYMIAALGRCKPQNFPKLRDVLPPAILTDRERAAHIKKRREQIREMLMKVAPASEITFGKKKS